MTAVIRTIILYLLIIVGIRLMGKRQIGELEPSELVLSLIIADLAAVPMQDFGTPLIMGVIPILTLLCLSAILSVLTVKSIRFRALLCSRPSIVIQDGKIIVGEMRRNRFTIDELMEELRMAGITDLSQVKYIDQLSYTFRYIIQNGQSTLMTLDEELKFIEACLRWWSAMAGCCRKTFGPETCPWVGSKGSWPNGALQTFAKSSCSRWMRRGTCI